LAKCSTNVVVTFHHDVISDRLSTVTAFFIRLLSVEVMFVPIAAVEMRGIPGHRRAR
jgi:hypothetical protein